MPSLVSRLAEEGRPLAKFRLLAKELFHIDGPINGEHFIQVGDQLCVTGNHVDVPESRSGALVATNPVAL
jgi:hypothetical protein